MLNVHCSRRDVAQGNPPGITACNGERRECKSREITDRTKQLRGRDGHRARCRVDEQKIVTDLAPDTCQFELESIHDEESRVIRPFRAFPVQRQRRRFAPGFQDQLCSCRFNR